ncbi:hypothetical protein [Sphingobium sp. YG1]|nr:hypothetical protein [Sphingobium sp. YG1]
MIHDLTHMICAGSDQDPAWIAFILRGKIAEKRNFLRHKRQRFDIIAHA